MVTANPRVFSKLPYNPAKDLTPIIVLCRITPVLVINPSLPAQSVAGADRARQGPTRRMLNYGCLRHRRLRASRTWKTSSRKPPSISCTFRIAARLPPRPTLLAGDVSMLLLNLSSIEAHQKTGKAPHPRRRQHQAGGAAARSAHRGRGRRAGLRDHRLVRAVGAGPTWRPIWWRRLRRRRQGPGPAAVARVLAAPTTLSVTLFRRRSSPRLSPERLPGAGARWSKRSARSWIDHRDLEGTQP